MVYRIPPLNSVRAFEAAARHMSFSKAADELAVTPSALSYQIRQLEDFLQISLFKRLNRAVELTPAGEAIAPRISEGFIRIDEAFAAIRPDNDPHKLVVSTGPAFSAKWLAPRLHKFIELYPDIDFRLSASLKLTDFIADGVDAAIRFGSGEYPGLHVEPMFAEVVMPMLSPAAFEAAGGVADAGLFERVRLLHDDSISFLPGNKGWADWMAIQGYDAIDSSRGSRFSHADHGIDAAVDGGGVVLARLSMAFRDLVAGRLVAPFELAMKVESGFFFCCPPEKLDQQNVAMFAGWLRDEVAGQAEAMAKFMAGRKMV